MTLSLRTGNKILFILLMMTSLCLLTVSLTSAKYAVGAVSGYGARTAAFGVSTTLGKSRISLNGSEKKIGFTVTNGENHVSEVDIEYDVILTFYSELGTLEEFEISLLNNGEQRGNRKMKTEGDKIICTFTDVGKFKARIKATDHIELCFSEIQPDSCRIFELDIDVLARQVAG